MNKRLVHVAERIRSELDELEAVLKRVKEGSIRSHKTYTRYVITIERVTGKKIDKIIEETK